MAELVQKTNIKREKGIMYFIKNNPLEIWRAKMGRQKKGEAKPAAKDETPDEIPDLNA